MNSSCLDHVYTTNPCFIANICVPNNLVLWTIYLYQYSLKEKYSKEQRDQFHSTSAKCCDLKNFNANELLKGLQYIPWDSVVVFDDAHVNDVVSSIETLFYIVQDQHFSLKSKRA